MAAIVAPAIAKLALPLSLAGAAPAPPAAVPGVSGVTVPAVVVAAGLRGARPLVRALAAASTTATALVGSAAARGVMVDAAGSVGGSAHDR